MKPVGIAEIADLLKVSRPRARQLADRDDFPEPEERLAMGPVYDEAKVKRWIRRHRPGLLAVTVVIAALVLCVPASAQSTRSERIAVMQEIAAEQFPSVEAACGEVKVEVAPLVTETATAEALLPCGVRLNPHWYLMSRAELCLTMAHEYGHLAGLDHVHDPLNIMDQDAIPAAVPECLRLDLLEIRMERVRYRVGALRVQRLDTNPARTRTINRRLRPLVREIRQLRLALGA